MRAVSQTAKPLSLAQTSWALLRHHLGNRKVLALLAVAIVGAGLALNWSWLVAAGIAPVLLALAPCAAMCALGLCMGKKDAMAKDRPSDAPRTGREAE